MFEVSGQMSAENMDTDTVQFVFYTRFLLQRYHDKRATLTPGTSLFWEF